MKYDLGGMKGRLRSAYRSVPGPLRRVSVLLLGMVMLVAGLAMLVLPGPGLLVLGLAVAVLALEFDWARRLAERVSRATWRLAHRLGFSRP